MGWNRDASRDYEYGGSDQVTAIAVTPTRIFEFQGGNLKIRSRSDFSVIGTFSTGVQNVTGATYGYNDRVWFVVGSNTSIFAVEDADTVIRHIDEDIDTSLTWEKGGVEWLNNGFWLIANRDDTLVKVNTSGITISTYALPDENYASLSSYESNLYFTAHTDELRVVNELYIEDETLGFDIPVDWNVHGVFFVGGTFVFGRYC